MIPCPPDVRPPVRPRVPSAVAARLRSAAVLPLLVCLACAPDGAPAEVRIGLLALTDPGYLASSGTPSIQGAEMARNEINASGGIVVDGRSHRVRIVVGRYEARPDAAATRARALLNQDSVHALVGPQLSGHAIPVSVIAEDVGVPMISPMSSNPETTRGKALVSRLAFLDAAQGGAMGRFAVDSLGATRAAILFDESSAYSRSVAASFRAGFRRAGGEVVAEETYTLDRNRTFVDQLTRIRDARPDVLLLPNVTKDDSVQVREARALGIDAVFLGSDRWDLHSLRRVPEAEGAFVSHQWLPGLAGPAEAAFSERFTATYGKAPRSTAALTYDAVMILAVAASDAGTIEGTGWGRAIREIRDHEGVAGPVSFDGSGDPRRGVALSTIRDGTIVSLRLIQP